MNVPVLDHLIISERSYYSFRDHGLMNELEESLKYVPPYEIKRRYQKQAQEVGEVKGKKERSKEIARAMKQKGVDTELIVEFTGLKASIINRLKID
jgi:DNA repair protein RadC